MNSLPLNFLFYPFKASYTIFLIILIIFGLSTFTQTYFDASRSGLVAKEIEQLNNIQASPLLSQWKKERVVEESNSAPINLRVSRFAYQAFSFAFYDLTYVNTALKAKSEADAGFKFKNYLMPRLAYLHAFDDTLRVIAIRIGNICLYLSLAILTSAVAAIDGLAMRAIRQKNASRESAGIYHRAKYWRSGVVWLGILIYLCTPVAVTPYILLVPVCLNALFVFIQAKYLKKYL